MSGKQMAVSAANSFLQNDSSLIQVAASVSLDQIPGLVMVLTSRWLVETDAKARELKEQGATRSAEKLLTSGELAIHLNLPESWVRTEERQGRIPGVRLGKYVRFRLSEVEKSLAQNQPRKP
jgi:excisionase family DNA binding protein